MAIESGVPLTRVQSPSVENVRDAGDTRGDTGTQSERAKQKHKVIPLPAGR